MLADGAAPVTSNVGPVPSNANNDGCLPAGWPYPRYDNNPKLEDSAAFLMNKEKSSININILMIITINYIIFNLLINIIWTNFNIY